MSSVYDDTNLVDVYAQDVRIFDDRVTLQLGAGLEKTISLEDFRNILNRLMGQQEDTKLDGFSLPSNVYFFAKSGSDIQLSCYYQSRIAQIAYYEKKMKIVMPNVIVSHTLGKLGEKEWKVNGSKYFCTDSPVSRLPRDFINSVNHRNRIFLLPMSNTYVEGNMCFGQNSMPNRFTENNLRGLDWYYQYMFESPFNDDLGIYAVSRGVTPANWYAKLKDLASENKPFPYSELTGFTAI